MNTEEAIKVIQDFIGWFKTDSRIYKALEMAIQALSQEPCETISRQTYADWLDWLCRLRSEINSGMDMARVPQGHRDKYIDVLTEVIDKLPSVTQKPIECDDAISRQAVLDGLASIAKVKARSDAQKALMGRIMFFTEQLPSVTPQQKTGRWIFDEILDKHYYCSECKSMGVNYWDFCPNCGAKMVEPQESEVEE